MVTAEAVDIGYQCKCIVHGFDYAFKKGKIHTIIGPNGSGKSTVFKGISRLLSHQSGNIRIGDQKIECYKPKCLAKILAVLSQSNSAPSDFTVRDLLRFGRTPHKKMFESMNQEDEAIVDWAIEVTHLKSLESRRVSCLSGGERQRAWIAMNLVQQPQVLLLDEPTTYLDIQHQFEVMELIKSLNQKLKMTIVMILHDLNQASLYSDEIVVLKEGRIVCAGSPEQVMNPEMIQSVYRVKVEMGVHHSGRPMVIPVGI